VPLAWEELEGLTSADRWTASNIKERLEIGNAPWAEYDASRHSIIPAMKILGFKPTKTAKTE
jgi:bifunctional non-homologous end joining protein LigD